jgi:methylthioribose-1-phosphate isomerase
LFFLNLLYVKDEERVAQRSVGGVSNHPLLKIRCPRPAAFNIITKIKHNARKKINYQRETNRQKRSINKEKSYFRDRDIKTLAQIGTNPKGVTFKKSEYSL